MCPICVTSPTHRSRSRFASLADHIATVHDENTVVDDEDPLSSLVITKMRRGENEEVSNKEYVIIYFYSEKHNFIFKEDSDEEDDDDDEPSLNDLEHRAFIEEEHRRQEAARQRLAHATSLAAAIRNEYAAVSSGSANSQRRPFMRQTAIRGARAGLRGKE